MLSEHILEKLPLRYLGGVLSRVSLLLRPRGLWKLEVPPKKELFLDYGAPLWPQGMGTFLSLSAQAPYIWGSRLIHHQDLRDGA